MTNKRIILWLLLFFPMGIYLMFKYSDWSKTVKLGISSLFAMFTLIGGVILIYLLIFIGAFVFSILGIRSFIRKESKQKSLALAASGLLLFTGSFQITETIEAEQIAIEQAELKEQAEQERIAEEKRQEEIAKQEELERVAEQKKLRAKILSELDKLEVKPTQRNYDSIDRLLAGLDDKNDLVSRLDELKSLVEEYEEAHLIAREAVEKAESEKSRSSYDEALGIVSTLSIANETLNNRLSTLDTELTTIEEEQLALEQKDAEEKRITEEKRVVEEARVAAEKQAATQAANQAAQQSSQRNREATNKPAAVQSVAPPADNVEKTVYIAPQSGTKYHYSAGCRGLNNANSVKKVSLSEAKSQGYDLCGWEK